MKLKIGGVFFLLILAGIFMMGCRDGNIPDEDTDTPVTVAFTDLIADGSPTAITTKLTLTFDKDIDGLAAADMSFNAGTTGAGKGALTKVNGVTGKYDLALSGITDSGEVSVQVAKTGYTITGSPKSVTVFRAPSGKEPVAVTFTGLTADGSSTAATTKLILTFDKDIAGLSAADLSLTGTTGASKGALTRTGTGIYELAVSGITTSGSVTVAVAKTDFTITGGPKSVTVYPAPPVGPVAVTFNNLSANGSSSTVTTKLTLTFDKDIAGLAATDMSLTAGTTGASRGSLTRVGTGVYELAISGVTANGNVTVAVAKTGFTITGSPKTVAIFYPNSSSGTKVTTWKGLSAPTATNATQYTSYQGRNDVLHVSPNSAYEWRVLYYSLSAYAGKEITITLGMDVWLTTATKVAWQAQLGDSYPTIAGSTSTNQPAGQWVSINGSSKITVPTGGGTLYLSSQQLGENAIYITNFIITIDDGSGTNPDGKTLTLTIGAKENLTSRIDKFNPAGRTLTWSSSSNSVATVNSNGIVTAAGFTTGGTSTASSAATGTATITVTASGAAPNTDTFTINTTMVGQVDMMTLPPLKDQFASHFLMGNIATTNDANSGGTEITNTRLTRHYNVLTAENDMKPSYYGGSRNGATVEGLTWTNPDRFVNAATASGFKVHAHVLLWHSQNSDWIKAVADEANKTTAIAAMQSYITQVVDRYKGKIYSWDVLNEVFPDGVSASGDWKTSMRTTGDSQGPNPWYMAIGSDFVYEGFLAARLADPDAILYYNDYNLDSPGKAAMVRDMVEAVNAKYAEKYPLAGRKLIEGIGMQSHHNTNVSSDAVKATLDMFRLLGVKISISEIDVLCMGYSEFSGSTGSGPNKSDQSIATNNQKLQAANLYGQYFKLFVDNADIIERVTFWGVYDEQSWRSGGLPLPFEGATTSKAKTAYYKVVGTLE